MTYLDQCVQYANTQENPLAILAQLWDVARAPDLQFATPAGENLKLKKIHPNLKPEELIDSFANYRKALTRIYLQIQDQQEAQIQILILETNLTGKAITYEQAKAQQIQIDKSNKQEHQKFHAKTITWDKPEWGRFYELSEIQQIPRYDAIRKVEHLRGNRDKRAKK